MHVSFGVRDVHAIGTNEDRSGSKTISSWMRTVMGPTTFAEAVCLGERLHQQRQVPRPALHRAPPCS